MADKTIPERIKFKIEFFILMFSCGRTEEAEESLTEALQLCDQLIEADKGADK